MLHLVGQGLEKCALACPGGPQEKGHAARLDGSGDIVQDDKSVLAGPDANEANQCLQSEFVTSAVEMCLKEVFCCVWQGTLLLATMQWRQKTPRVIFTTYFREMGKEHSWGYHLKKIAVAVEYSGNRSVA